jgi:hypothetical protein
VAKTAVLQALLALGVSRRLHFVEFGYGGSVDFGQAVGG